MLARIDKVVNINAPTHDIRDLLNDSVRASSVVLHGYVASIRNASKRLSFIQLLSTDLSHSVQLVASSASLLEEIRSCESHVPVCVTGTVKSRDSSSASTLAPLQSTPVRNCEIELTSFIPLNDFPKDGQTIAEGSIVPAADQRYLQIRMDKSLREALVLRSRVCQVMRKFLCDEHGFLEVETPILFKSTPEGAREYLVPTRTPGHAYALPQSPQQYKQLLMAGGIARYMQIARCFRDEDRRADRQPEFTQLDLEMAFATGSDIMAVIESLVRTLWRSVLDHELGQPAFPQMTYQQAMDMYGSDKPDRRLGLTIHRIDHLLPVDLVAKISGLQKPIIEMIKVPMGASPRETRDFVASFMDSAEARTFMINADGQPGIFIYDEGKPLSGLQPLGFEAAERVEDLVSPEHGDLIMLQARAQERHTGQGCTIMGNLRLAIHSHAVRTGLLPKPSGWDFLWVTDFPLFTPNSPGDLNPDVSQKSFASTHHPFTSPKTPEDVDMLFDDPSKVIAEHYDLVLNGTEIGGGSKRIHIAEIQRAVFRVILGMSEDRIERDFGHLLRALRAGCPPHAGIALGLDRLVAVMLGKSSVQDVIAFPKTGARGEDLTVGAPSPMTDAMFQTYHLQRAKT